MTIVASEQAMTVRLERRTFGVRNSCSVMLHITRSEIQKRILFDTMNYDVTMPVENMISIELQQNEGSCERVRVVKFWSTPVSGILLEEIQTKFEASSKQKGDDVEH